MKVFIISSELSKPKTAHMIASQLEGFIPKKNQKFFDSSSKDIFHRKQKDRPHFVILHKTNGKTKKLQDKIKEIFPEAHILPALDNQWGPILEILESKLAIA
jgi:hypothetical protein